MIRSATDSDAQAITRVLEAAFPGPDEARLVTALGPLTEVSLVSTDEAGQIVGHVLVSRASLVAAQSDDPAPAERLVLVLAPLGVLPSAQRSGHGSALCRAAVEACRATAYPLVSVLGEPEFYARFGFEPAGPLGVVAPFAVPERAWQLLRLPAWRPGTRGRIAYPPPWDAVL